MDFLWNDLLYNPMINLLVFFYDTIPGHDMGIAIILLTILIRIIILPLGLKAARSQRKMKRLAPELNKLKAQFKNDRQGLAQAQMELYKQYGVSPMSSCLPILIQLPLIWALYRVLQEGLGDIDPARIYSFVNLPAHLDTHFFGLIDLATVDKIYLPILAGVAQYVLTIMTVPTPSGNTPQEKMMSKQMTIMMPLVTVFFAMSFPAGLSLYWVATSVFGIAQQVWVNHEKASEIKVRVKRAGDDEVIVVEETKEIELGGDDKK